MGSALGRVHATLPMSLFPSSDCGFLPSPGPGPPIYPLAGTPSLACSAPAARGSWRATSRREVGCVSSTCPTPRTWWWEGNVAMAFWRKERTVTAGRWRYGAGFALPSCTGFCSSAQGSRTWTMYFQGKGVCWSIPRALPSPPFLNPFNCSWLSSSLCLRCSVLPHLLVPQSPQMKSNAVVGGGWIGSSNWMGWNH